MLKSKQAVMKHHHATWQNTTATPSRLASWSDKNESMVPVNFGVDRVCSHKQILGATMTSRLSEREQRLLRCLGSEEGVMKNRSKVQLRLPKDARDYQHPILMRLLSTTMQILQLLRRPFSQVLCSRRATTTKWIRSIRRPRPSTSS